MRNHRQFYVTESEPTEFVAIRSSALVVVDMPDGYVGVTYNQYLKLKWLNRKARILARKDTLKEKGAKLKAAWIEG